MITDIKETRTGIIITRLNESNTYRWMPILITLLPLFATGTSSVDILCLTPPLAGRGSHLALITNLCNTMQQNGHNATLLLQGPGTPPPSNLTIVRHKSAFSEENIEEYAKKFTVKSLDGDFGIFDLLGFIDRLSTDCEFWMSDIDMFQQLQRENFTIAIVDHFNFCGVLYARRLGLPVIILDTASYFSVFDSGVPIPLSYVPIYNSELTNQMDFWGRTINLIAYCGSIVMLHAFRKPFFEISRSYNITDRLTESSLFSDAELWLLNSDFTLEFPRPVLPNMIYVGGYMAKAAQPLSDPFRSLVDGYDGTIVVSFGSFYTNLTPELETSVIDTFSYFAQLIIWKHHTSLDTPSNVHTFDWVPQNNLVGHPKTKLLVSHCGMNSIMEAIYHGVPVVCVPFQGDQIDNAVRVKTKGLGLIVSPKLLTTERLQTAMRTVLLEQRFKDKASLLSKMFHDQPLKPLDRAVFAINTTIKFVKQDDKVQISNLSFWQYYMIDATLFLCLTVSLLLLGLLLTVRFVLKTIWYSTKYFLNSSLNKKLDKKTK